MFPTTFHKLQREGLIKINGFLAGIKSIKSNIWLYIFVVPGILWFLLFCYKPMYGILIAFKEYDLHAGVFASKWVGFKYFLNFFRDTNFKNLMINTVAISLLKLIFGFPAPIILAILLNEVRNKAFKRISQTISYLPFFISWVVVAGIWTELFTIDQGGVVNTLLINMGLIKEPVFWFGDPNYFWGMVVVSDIWKGVGMGTILYLAAIASVNLELYESAIIDGAGAMRRIWHITLPCIRPVIILLLILNMGNILNAGFDQIYVMQNAAVMDRAEIIDTYVLVNGVFRGNYEIGTAVGLFKSLAGVILLFSTNFIVKRSGEEGII